MTFPTPREVEESVQNSMFVIRAQEHQLIRLLTTRIDSVVNCESATPREKNNQLKVVASDIGRMVAPVSACKKGCSHCCKMAVVITSDEAEAIGSAINVTPHKPVQSLKSQEEMAQRFMGVPCPFLENDVCSIYAFRPLPCMTHYNLSSYPEICDVVNHPGHDVPNLDMRQLWLASAMVNLETSVFADIRSFFPLGKDT